MRIVIYCSFLLLVASSCKHYQEKAKPKDMPLTEAVYASGTIKAYNQYSVFATISGILKYRFVNEGDTIRTGDVLGEIQSDVSSIQVNNAAVLLEQAKKNAGPDSPILKQLQIEIESARIKMENDSINYIRFKNLYEGSAASKADMELRQVNYKTSLNTYNEALKNFSEKKTSLQTDYKNALNTLRINTTNSSDLKVRSMIDGEVYAFYKEPGEVVMTNDPLALLGDRNKFLLELIVDELDINKVKVGQSILVTLDTYGDKVFTAKVTKIYPLLDIKTQTFNVEAEFTKAPPRLYPGLTIEANIVIREKQNVLVIPKSFLLPGDSVITDKGKKKIKTGISNLEYTEVTEGLSINDFIYR